jgi:superfamily II DNA or RNA helicase
MRNKLQEKHSNEFVGSAQKGIMLICPRYGKCRLGFKTIYKTVTKESRILIMYPDNKIKKSWQNELKEVEMKYEHDYVYYNYSSIHKIADEKFDFIIFDEIHDTSEKQKGFVELLVQNNPVIMGLTGTLSNQTKNDLALLGLPIISTYTVEEGITDGLLPQFEINVHMVPLDNKKPIYEGKRQGKSIKRTEKEQFDVYTYMLSPRNPRPLRGDAIFRMRLKRMNVIKDSIAKKTKLQSLLKKYKDERVLIFTGKIKKAESVSKSHHSKNEEKENIEKFINKKIQHLAVVGIGGAGITYQDLDRVILEFINSNAEAFEQKIARCLNNEYNGKLAKIDIIISSEEAERNWLESALQNIKKSRIKWKNT